MTLSNTIAVLAAGLALSGASFAAEHPELTGTWVLDAAKSDFGPMPVPADLVVTITGKSPDYQMHQTGGGRADMDLRFSTSGQPVVNDLPRAKMTSTHRWEGDVLVGEVLLETADGAKITFKDRVSCSADGKVMTTERTMSGPMGEGKMKMVMNRKAAQ